MPAPRSSSRRRASRSSSALLTALAATWLAASAVACSPATRDLVVTDLTASRVLHRERVTPGARFTLAYVHSSEHVPVRGVFRVERDGSLTVVETAFAGFGPGLPALREGDRWRTADGMIVAESDTRLDDLTVRVVPVTQHRLTTPAGHELPLSALVPAGTAIRVSVE
jgi:hypothetical protein